MRVAHSRLVHTHPTVCTRLIVAVTTCLLAGCLSMPGDQASFEADPGTLDGSDDPSLATVQITGVVVGFIGTGMVVENH